MANLEMLVEQNSKQIAEVWALFRETRENINNLSKEVSRVTRELESVKAKWGKFVEFVLAPGIPKAFQVLRRLVLLEQGQKSRR